MTKPLNIAHRGGAGLWPENTLFAFVSAAKSGFDGAELDVQLTRDGRLVVFHDFRLNPDLCRDASGQWLHGKHLPLIRDLTFAELQSFDVGRPKPGTLYAHMHRKIMVRDGERMPALADVIAGVRAVKKDFRLFIELKTSVDEPTLSAPVEAVAEAVVAELKNLAFGEFAVLVGFDWKGLIHAKTLDPALRCWFSTSRNSPAGAEDIKARGGDGWFCAANHASAEAVRAARACGLSFGAWTVNTRRAMRALITANVDAICTDRPDALATLLR
ncbi:MAG TPA: glycerophosphodiester phosphodiesterase family protein [Micropepsaceae bacterium]|nr:glycerophosphodiester phosphodiesterase family protein [Micropepsaceae bacterium]